MEGMNGMGGMDGMDGGATPLAQGKMTSYLHFTPGDTLWLEGWVPGRSSTLWGACIGLILLGIWHRWLAAVRANIEQAILYETSPRDEMGSHQFSFFERTILFRGAAPFVFNHAWARGSLQMSQATLDFLFMLAVMTYQVGFILSIVLGLGIGEMMYGRYIDAAYAAIGF